MRYNPAAALLCSSSNALIYGEEIAKDLEMQLQIFASRKMIYYHSRARFTGSMDSVLHGDSNDWIADLMPDIDGYLERCITDPLQDFLIVSAIRKTMPRALGV